MQDTEWRISDFREGDRIELHPATDRWMQGDRFGSVTRVGRKYLRVQMDRSGQSARVRPENVGRLING